MLSKYSSVLALSGILDNKVTNMVFVVALISYAGLSFAGTGCMPGEGNIKAYETHDFAMGTPITQRIYGDNAQEAAREVINEINRIEKIMTINKPGGEINRLNDSAGKAAVELAGETIYVLEKAKYYSMLSGGAFDITIGPLVKAWSVLSDNPRVPEDEELRNLLKLVDYRDITINRDAGTVSLQKAGQIADLGGIAKGYAGDRAVQIYKKHGIKSAFVNLGGNVVVLGRKPDGALWKIGIQDPRSNTGDYICLIEIEDKAVVTSGDYQRYFEKDGKRYHHIIDPNTGYPAESGLFSTTIVSDLSIDADALSTATFVMGLDKGLELIETLEGVDAVFVTYDKKVYATENIKKVLTFSGEDRGYEYVEER
jgi:thiamine biosynthesis lipoprotein